MVIAIEENTRGKLLVTGSKHGQMLDKLQWAKLYFKSTKYSSSGQGEEREFQFPIGGDNPRARKRMIR